MFDAHATQKVAGGDMNPVGSLVGARYRFITNAANETVAVHHHIDIFGYQQFHAAQESVDVNFLVLADDSVAQIQAQTAAKGVKPCSMESLTFIYVLVSAKPHKAADAFAVFTQRQGALQPLRRVLLITVDDEFASNVEQEQRTEVLCPTMVPVQVNDAPHVSQLQQGCHDKNDSDDCSSAHNACLLMVVNSGVLLD